MPHKQERMSNPFGMDESCPKCPELVQTRSSIVHGYGDVTADFVFVLPAPHEHADSVGHPAVAESSGRSILDLLKDLGLVSGTDADGAPALENAFVTYLTRCYHPERSPTSREIDNCEPFLNAEIRSINPEVLAPIGECSIRTIVGEFTTQDPASVDPPAVHGTTMRGRGFELLPAMAFGQMDEETYQTYLDHVTATMQRDYRQTKGRRRR